MCISLIKNKIEIIIDKQHDPKIILATIVRPGKEQNS